MWALLEEDVTKRALTPLLFTTTLQRWPHLVYNYSEDRSLQESLCSQVWNECSHRESAALVERLSVLAQGQEAALQEGV